MDPLTAVKMVKTELNTTTRAIRDAASTFRGQNMMMEHMRRHYNGVAYNNASQRTKDHNRLYQTDRHRRKNMSLPI